MTEIAPFGAWESPISAADTIAGAVGFSEPRVDGDTLYWLEGRPDEGGREVIVRRTADGAITDVTPRASNVRSRVHEYGGGAFAVRDGVIVYSEFADQRLYRISGDGPPVAITPEPPRPASVRYADADFVSADHVVCVRETHREEGEAVNELVALRIDGVGAATVLASGRDFYSSPRVSPDGSQLAWLEWDHPNMPWDGTELRVAPLAMRRLEPRRVAGGTTESVSEPSWAPDGTLVFISDRTGWWNPYRFDGEDVHPIVQRPVEFSNPAWVFRYSSYGFLSGGRILAAYWDGGRHVLAVIGAGGEVDVLDLGYTRYSDLVTDGARRAWAATLHAGRPSALIEIDTGSGEAATVRTNPEAVPAPYRPTPELISFPTTGGEVAHGIFYPPVNPDFTGSEGARPPLIVKVHGGPTSAAYPRLNPAYVYWTSRGFGVVDVNHRGSTGYGREFRTKLDGGWGVVDIDDCVAAARYLAAEGKADPDGLVITGGSAGGYTTLAALAFRDGFSGGAAYYGVADVGLLAAHTHKFESRYLNRLIPPEEWEARSPINSIDGIDVPVVLFQGLEDQVVPPEQARVIAAALRRNGVAHLLVEYGNEGHGFRDAGNIVRSLETELAFYGKVLGFTPAGDVPDIELVSG